MAAEPARQLAEPLDDVELVRRARARDGTAFRTIMERNNRRLYRIARSILRNDSEAEDVVQEALLKPIVILESFAAMPALRRGLPASRRMRLWRGCGADVLPSP